MNSLRLLGLEKHENFKNSKMKLREAQGGSEQLRDRKAAWVYGVRPDAKGSGWIPRGPAGYQGVRSDTKGSGRIPRGFGKWFWIENSKKKRFGI